MRKQTFVERIINWLKSLFCSKKKIKENSDEIKREMCKKSCSKRCMPTWLWYMCVEYL